LGKVVQNITINKPSPPAPLPKPDPRKSASVEQIAVLEINGVKYDDWETIMVRHAEEEGPFYTFRFTCSEGMPLANNFAKLQIRPGDVCQVTLAGQEAVNGWVSTRQVFYDSQRHYVEIQGASNVQGLAYTSAITKTMEFKDVTFEKYARALLKPTGINLLIRNGVLPQIKFPRISIAHGMSIMEALEIPLRNLGHFAFTSNPQGDLVINAKGQGASSGAVFIEGKNIIEGREIIINVGAARDYYSSGQRTGNDKTNGSNSARVHSDDTQGVDAKFDDYSPSLAVPDMPVDKQMVNNRSKLDLDMMKQDQVTVFVTVWGWLQPNGQLWKQGYPYTVKSPMLLMTGSEKLNAKSVTFTQDNARGTRTQLELCNDAAWYPHVPAKGQGGKGVGGDEDAAAALIEGGGTP